MREFKFAGGVGTVHGLLSFGGGAGALPALDAITAGVTAVSAAQALPDSLHSFHFAPRRRQPGACSTPTAAYSSLLLPPPSSFMSAAVITRTASPAFDDSRRQSTVSTSAASFLTAPQHSSTFPSRNSSVHTLNSPQNKDNETIGPIHAFALPSKPSSQEVHIVQVIDDTVCLETTSVSEPAFRKVTPPFYRQRRPSDSTESAVGPPPPSPPSSAENEPPHPTHQSKPEQGGHAVTFDDSIDDGRSSSSNSRDQTQSSLSSRQFPPLASSSRTSVTSPPHVLLHRSSTETKTSMTMARVSQSTLAPRMTRSSNQSDGPPDLSKDSPSPKGSLHAGAHTSPDGFLQAPSTSSVKQARRNTTGSTSPPARPIRMMTVHGGAHTSTGEDGELEGELASDIQLQAEQIRRERQSKRVKAQQEADRAKAQQDAERALTRTTSLMRASSTRGDEPLVGNLIGEDHVNYVLMYNMLTGIRVAVRLFDLPVLTALLMSGFWIGLSMSGQDQTTIDRRGLHCTTQVLVRYVSAPSPWHRRS